MMRPPAAAVLAIAGCAGTAPVPVPAPAIAREAVPSPRPDEQNLSGGMRPLENPIAAARQRFQSTRFSADADELGRAWLAAHQNADGGWGEGGSDAGSTGIALLAFLGVGETHQFGSQKDVVREGLRWLVRHMDPEGRIAAEGEPVSVRRQAFAALALCEAYGLTGSHLFHEPAERVIAWLLRARNDDGGWGAEPRDGASEVTLTAWAALALADAGLSEVCPSPDCLPSVALVTSLTDVDSGEVRERAGEGPTLRATAAAAVLRLVCLPSMRVNSLFPQRDPVTERVVARALRWPPDAATEEVRQSGPARLAAPPPDADDPERLYFATCAAWTSSKERRDAWRVVRNQTLAPRQLVAPHPAAGSWDPAPGRSRIEATALYCMIMQTTYRYASDW